jgi:hypothetical protein
MQNTPEWLSLANIWGGVSIFFVSNVLMLQQNKLECLSLANFWGEYNICE